MTAAVLAVLVLLLLYPLHVPYQNPDQDLPLLAAFIELLTGGWRPWTMHYPSAFTNLLRAGAELAVVVTRIDAAHLAALWDAHRAAFRLAPRLVSAAGGVVSLLAVQRLGRLVADRWTGLAAAALLGTSVMFVREHHFGMWDAPLSAATILALYASARYVATPRLGWLVVASALAGFALAIKYNGAAVAVAPVVALVVAPVPVRTRLRWAVVAAFAAGLAVLGASPAMLLQPDRVVAELKLYPVFYAVYRAQAARFPVPYALSDLLRIGLGLPLLAASVLGIVIVLRRRVRVLAPLLAFVVAYGVVLWRSPLALNRYAVPIAAPLALLAAYGLSAPGRRSLQIAGLAALVLLDLPPCVATVRLLARTDTRVESARWLAAHVRPDARVFLPGDAGFSAYVGPDLPRPFDLLNALTPERRTEVVAAMTPGFTTDPRFFTWSGRSGGTDPLAPWANGIVVTSTYGEGPFVALDTPAGALDALRSRARLLLDLHPDRKDGRRVYEAADLNYAPIAGMATLDRPGPRIQIWFVPGDGDEPTPFLADAITSRAARAP